MFKGLILTFFIGFSPVMARDLFTPKEKRKLVELKSAEFTNMNFKKAIKDQNQRNLSMILQQMSKKDKELLDHQLKNKPWAKLDEEDTRRFMNKWIMKELLMDRTDRKN